MPRRRSARSSRSPRFRPKADIRTYDHPFDDAVATYVNEAPLDERKKRHHQKRYGRDK
jgi:hypothetical protein